MSMEPTKHSAPVRFRDRSMSPRLTGVKLEMARKDKPPNEYNSFMQSLSKQMSNDPGVRSKPRSSHHEGSHDSDHDLYNPQINLFSSYVLQGAEIANNAAVFQTNTLSQPCPAYLKIVGTVRLSFSQAFELPHRCGVLRYH